MRVTRVLVQMAVVGAAGAAFVRLAGQTQDLAGKTAEQAYKNIQVLKGTPAAEVVPAMRVIGDSLGVNCDFCHADDPSKDDKPAKQVARKMIAMMGELNRSSFDGRTAVTCYTCHRGSAEPFTVSLIEGRGYAPPGYTLNRPGPGSATGAALPTAGQILAKYEQALGGADALRRVTTRIVISTRVPELAPRATSGGLNVREPRLELNRYSKVPDKSIMHSIQPTGGIRFVNGADGKIAWSSSVLPNPVIREGTGEDDAHQWYFYGYLPLDVGRLEADYERLDVHGVQKMDQRDTYLVVGALKEPRGDRELLYFDTETGYLLRRARVREARTAVGGGTTQTDFEGQTDFDDYRDIGDGTKMPFMFRSANPINRVRINHIKVIDNVPMDDSLFTKPPSRYCEAGFKLQHYDLKTQKFLAYTLTPDCLIAPGAAPLPAEAALGMLEK